MAAVVEASGKCKHCGDRVMVRRPGTNHVLHLILTVLTCGLWLIVWLGSAIQFGGWRCTKCGGSASRNIWR